MPARRPRGQDKGEVGLPITAMLDMTFQILAFFVITFKPPVGIEGQMALSLPKEEKKASHTKDFDPLDQPDKDKPIDEEAPTVFVRAQGGENPTISAITIRKVSGDVAVEPRSEKQDALFAELTRLLKEERSKQPKLTNIKLQGDGRLRWSDVIEVMDVCKNAGFPDVSFLPPPQS